jgi:hypothetical protein
MSSLDELLNLSLEDKREIIAEYIWYGVFLSPGLFVCFRLLNLLNSSPAASLLQFSEFFGLNIWGKERRDRNIIVFCCSLEHSL